MVRQAVSPMMLASFSDELVDIWMEKDAGFLADMGKRVSGAGRAVMDNFEVSDLKRVKSQYGDEGYKLRMDKLKKRVGPERAAESHRRAQVPALLETVKKPEGGVRYPNRKEIAERYKASKRRSTRTAPTPAEPQGVRIPPQYASVTP